MYYKTSIYLLYLLLKTSVLPCRGVEKASVVSEEEHCSVIWHMCLVSAGSCTSYGTLTHLNHLCGPQFPYLWNTHRLITFFFIYWMGLLWRFDVKQCKSTLNSKQIWKEIRNAEYETDHLAKSLTSPGKNYHITLTIQIFLLVKEKLSVCWI